MRKKIAILAVQGAFVEHKYKLEALGAECVLVRQKNDFTDDINGIVLPGGESSVQGKLMRDLGLLDLVQNAIVNQVPVLGTCAGLILLADTLSNDDMVHLQTLPVTVKRNAYGRQLGSFRTCAAFGNYGDVPMTFIRAPYIEQAREDVEILATVDEHIVGVRYQNQIGLSFHPELDEDNTIHQMFLEMC